MFLPQNLKDYLNNPMGKGSTAITHRELIKTSLNVKYTKLLKENNDLKYTIYRDKEEYYFHFIIPSETKRSNTYDVVIQFTMNEDNFKNDNTLDRYYLKFFSNSPSFTYTYAYVYNDYGLLINPLKGKYNRMSLKDNPVIRNPGEIINYEKSIYFACYYLLNHSHLLKKINLNESAIKYNKNVLIKKIRNTDQIHLEIKKETGRLREEKTQERKLSKSNLDNKKINGTKKEKVKPVSKTNNIIKKIKPVKSTVKKK